MAESIAPSASPASLGYRWPAEWEPHAATWLSWPHKRESWPDKFEPVPGEYAHFVRTLARFEPVQILAGGAAVMAEARELVGDVPGVTLHDVPTNDAWMRDHGPTFLGRRSNAAGPASLPPALVDWRFDSWGGKYPPYALDDAVPARLAERLGYRRFAVDWVLEGGAIDGNGCGTILTTASCLLDPQRNPSVTRELVERHLAEQLGARHVLWLAGGGIAGDDTDGHIDQLARFVNPTTIVAAVEENTADENAEPLARNCAELAGMTDQDGRPLTIVLLPMPSPKYFREQRIPASYLNFLIANGVVLVPQFGDPRDDEVLARLRPLFPGREVVGLPALNLAWGLGTFHCLSQQQPR